MDIKSPPDQGWFCINSFKFSQVGSFKKGFVWEDLFLQVTGFSIDNFSLNLVK